MNPTEVLIEPPTYHGRFYVYVLLNPETSSPFYVGKGTSNRIVEHFRMGRSPEEIYAEDDEPNETGKTQTISDLRSKGYEAKHIARVVGRRLSEESALAIEGLLIKSVYGRGPSALTNIADGHHTERFRAKDDWAYKKKYDLPIDQQGHFTPYDARNELGEFYVYVLRNPKNGQIFYVGKGRGRRLCDHFRDANADETIPTDRLEEIRGLFRENYKPNEIGRIIARVSSEQLAFVVESFYIKFILGFQNLHNIQSGHASGLFRAFKDWELRVGFDIPIVIEKGQARNELLDIFLGEGLDTHLQEVVDILALREPKLALEFSPPKVVGAGELAIMASIPDVDFGVKLRIQIRGARRFQVMLYPESKSGKEWVGRHFKRLDAYPLRRKDDMFIPSPWRSVQNVTADPTVTADRVLQLIALTRVQRRQDMGNLGPLLDGLPWNGGKRLTNNVLTSPAS